MATARLERLRRDADASGDAALRVLHDELLALPFPISTDRIAHVAAGAVAVPLVLRDPASSKRLSFLSATTVFGTAVDVTLAELTIECFYPADETTRAALLASPVRQMPSRTSRGSAGVLAHTINILIVASR